MMNFNSEAKRENIDSLDLSPFHKKDGNPYEPSVEEKLSLTASHCQI